MDAPESETVRQTLSQPDVHRQWIGQYYGAESPLYDAAFDRIMTRLAPKPGAVFLDVGCGDGAHTIRLAKRGYAVVAVDFSKYVLGEARKKVTATGLDQRVRFEHGSLLALPFADESFEYVLCWGVLMHIPEIERAISELARILKPNGFVIVSEDNMWSIESVLVRLVRRLLGDTLVRRLQGKDAARLHTTAAGAEFWRQTDAGPLICREARIPWLISRFKDEGLLVRARMPAEFIEREAEIQAGLLKDFVRGFNVAWFKHVRLPQPASANILLFEKVVR